MIYQFSDKLSHHYIRNIRPISLRLLKRVSIFPLLMGLLVLAGVFSIVFISHMHYSGSNRPVRKRPARVLVKEAQFMLRDNKTGKLMWNMREMKRVHGTAKPAKSATRSPAVAKIVPKKRIQVNESHSQFKFDNNLKMANPKLPPLTPDWLAQRKAIFEERSQRLVNVCSAYDVRIGRGSVTNRPGAGPVERINGDHFVAVPALNVTLCLLAKVASTSILSTLLRVTGQEVPKQEGNRTSLHGAAGALRLPPAQLGNMLRRSLTVLLVRHPLRRLVAAYRDKIASQANWPLLHHYEMLKYGRVPDSHLAQQLRERDLQQHRMEAIQRGGKPTFGEFLAVALMGDQPLRDAHWAPYWRYCAPCHVGYRLIGTLETASDDLSYLWHKLRLYYWVEVPWLHRSRPDQKEEGLQTLADTFLRPLDHPTMLALKREYKLDFDLFGYDWAGLMRMSGHCLVEDTKCDLL